MMTNTLLLLNATLLIATLLAGCSSSSHPVQPAAIGQVSSGSKLRASLSEPGPIRLEKLAAATWVVDRAGLINLDHASARAAGLKPGDEAIEIYCYRITHPEFGTYLIDSGVARSFAEPEHNQQLSWLVRQAMNTPALQLQLATGDWLESTPAPLNGVFLTHLHMDHIMGLVDIPAGVPVYTGPGETTERSLQNVFTQGTTDRLLGNVDVLREWQFAPDPDGEFAGVIDVFGDGSLWALHVPGHTPGSTAFLVRSTSGPQLITGDASHTAWGWRNSVEPGEFSSDQPLSAVSLATLKRLEATVSGLQVHPGHQSLTD